MLFDTPLTRHPHVMAITDLQHSRSWRQLHDQAMRFARYFQQVHGLHPDDHIALLTGNRVEFIEALLGAFLAGLWVTPINSHLLAEEVDYIACDSGARVLLHDDEHAALLRDGRAYAPVNLQALSSQWLNQPVETFSTPDPLAPAGGTMLYTSGTTGRPKGVKRSKLAGLDEALRRMRAGGQMFGLDGSGPHLVTGPLYHAAPMLFALYDLLNGAPMVILPRWDTDVFLETVASYRIAHTHLVPTMFVRLLNARERSSHQFAEHDLSSLTLVLHGAAPIAVSTKRQMIDWWGKILVEYWGGSEAGTTTLVNSDDWLTHPGTVGKPLAHFAVYVGDEYGTPSAETTGRLFAKHQYLPQVFEYHNDPEKTRKAHPQPYIFCIGDLGRVDQDGFVYLSDRESNMIISGGVNIYPAEIEQVLMEHAAIEDAAVFGVPNHEWGEEVCAAIQLKPELTASTALHDEILAFLRHRIARFKVPRSLRFVATLPRTPTGKLLVRQLKLTH